MFEQIAANRRRTLFLVAAAFVLLGVTGYVLGSLSRSGPIGLVVALAIAAAMSWASYFHGDALVLRSTGAVEVTPEQEPRLHNVVEGLALAAGIPKPRVYVVPAAALNAYATGRDPEHASIAVTRGLLDQMNRLELEGVIGHELAHVAGRDILLGTVVATLVGAVILISDFFLHSLWWGGMGRRDDREGGGNGILAIVGILFLILAPIAGRLVNLAVSRRREYLADAQGALFTRYPPGLVSALRKIEASSAIPLPVASNATAHLWLAEPTRPRRRGEGVAGLLSTHPPIEERIRRLEEM